MSEVKARFRSKVAPPNDRGCMEWTASRSTSGLPYGRFSIGRGRTYLAHRAIAEDYPVGRCAITRIVRTQGGR